MIAQRGEIGPVQRTDREEGPMNGIWQDLRFVVRMLAKHRQFTPATLAAASAMACW